MFNLNTNSKALCNALILREIRLCPPGTVESFAGINPPNGWLLCNGQTISRTTYISLFTAIGTIYGAGDGLTTFTLPDMRGRVSVAAGAGPGLSNRALGDKDGEEKHTLTINEMPSHTHDYIDTFRTGNQNADNVANSQTAADETVTNQTKTTAATGNGVAHNVMQPFIVLNYIIKY